MSKQLFEQQRELEVIELAQNEERHEHYVKLGISEPISKDVAGNADSGHRKV